MTAAVIDALGNMQVSMIDLANQVKRVLVQIIRRVDAVDAIGRKDANADVIGAPVGNGCIHHLKGKPYATLDTATVVVLTKVGLGTVSHSHRTGLQALPELVQAQWVFRPDLRADR